MTLTRRRILFVVLGLLCALAAIKAVLVVAAPIWNPTADEIRVDMFSAYYAQEPVEQGRDTYTFGYDGFYLFFGAWTTVDYAVDFSCSFDYGSWEECNNYGVVGGEGGQSKGNFHGAYDRSLDMVHGASYGEYSQSDLSAGTYSLRIRANGLPKRELTLKILN